MFDTDLLRSSSPSQRAEHLLSQPSFWIPLSPRSEHKFTHWTTKLDNCYSCATTRSIQLTSASDTLLGAWLIDLIFPDWFW